MDHNMFTSDIYAAAGMHESFPSFPQVEEDDRLPFQFVDFDTRYGDLAAVQSDYESIAHGYHENAWPAPHHINEGVRPSHLYAPPTDQYRGRTQSIATEDTSAAQGPTAAISPESAQSYNDVDLLDDADGDMDMEFAQLQTSDRQSFSQAETLCQSIAQTPQQPTPTRSNKTPRKSRRNGNSATSSSPLIFTPTTSAKSANSSKPTESKPNKKSRSRKGADGDAAQYICTWTGCGQACRIMSDYKKHMDKHTKPYRCNVGNCESGFTTSNDLSRHKASVHEMGNARYICQEGECRYRKFNKKTDDPAKKKHFVRKDNYMNHCRRMHQELDENILAKKWYVRTGHIIIDGTFEQAQHETVEPQNVQPIYDSQCGPYGVSDDISTQYSSEDFYMPAETCDPHYMETSPSSYGMQAARPESVCSSETTRQTSPSSSSVRSCPQARLSAVSSMTSSSIHKQVQREKRPREKEVVAPRSNKRYRTSDATSQAMPPASQAQQSLAVPAKAHHGPPNYVSRNQTSQDSCAPTGQAYLAPLPPPVQRPAQFYYHEGAPYHSLAGPPVNAPVHPTMAYMMAPSSSATTRSSQTLVAGRSRRPRTAPQPQTPVQNTAGNVCHVQGCGQSYASRSNLAKHKMRHERPFACTHDDCPVSKTFGSKHDWKRHEESQHPGVPEQWRCNTCRLLFDEQAAFISHMRGDTHNSRHTVARLESESHIRIAQGGGFWCGFCKSIQRIPRDAPIPMAARIDHIAPHFSSLQFKIEHWELPERGLTKGEPSNERDEVKRTGRRTRPRTIRNDDDSEESSAGLSDSDGDDVDDGRYNSAEDEDAEGDYDDDAVFDLTDDHDTAFLPRGRKAPVTARPQPTRNRVTGSQSYGRRPSSNQSSSTIKPSPCSTLSKAKANRQSSSWVTAPGVRAAVVPYRSRPRVAKTMFKCCQCKCQWSRETTEAVGKNECEALLPSGEDCGHLFCDTCHESDFKASRASFVPKDPPRTMLRVTKMRHDGWVIGDR